MRKLHQLEKEYILENYPLFGPKIVSEKLGRSQSTIINFAKKNNLTINNKLMGIDPPDFLVNLDFYSRFTELNPELCYWLGFMWADGTISNKTSIVIEIMKEDGLILAPIFNEIYPFYIHERSQPGRKPQISFSVNDKKVSELLINLGKYPKSIESHEKIYNYINNDNLWIYFLRGLIDGDGSFYLNKNEKYAQFTLASSIDQDWSFLLKNLEKFNPNITRTEKETGKSSVLRITGRNNIINFIKYLRYEDISIGLSRKMDKAIEILNLYKNNPPKDWKKHVLQFSKDGQFIKEYSSVLDASECTKIGKSAIRNCLAHISKSAGGFIWIYKEEYDTQMHND